MQQKQAFNKYSGAPFAPLLPRFLDGNMLFSSAVRNQKYNFSFRDGNLLFVFSHFWVFFFFCWLLCFFFPFPRLATCGKAGRPTKFAHSGKWSLLRKWSYPADSEVLPSAKWANLTSLDALLCKAANFTAEQLHFHVSENFTYYHPKNKSVTHYTLQDKTCEKEYEQKCSYSFLLYLQLVKTALW